MYFRKKQLAKSAHVTFGNNVLISFSTKCEGYNYIGNNSSATDSYFGYASYIADNTHIVHAYIGKFTSIGPGVKFVFGKHPTSCFVSTHPSFFSTQNQVGFSFTRKQLFKEYSDPIAENRYSIKIGNDVWIGANVLILDGVSIGDGAIVAAGAVVIKDIQPYTIVGGVPAKFIKNRFSQNQIDFLLKFKWWDKKITWLKSNAHLFTNIEHFQNTLENE